MPHSPSHTRKRFLDLLEEHVRDGLDKEGLAALRSLPGALWNCTDQMPASYYDDLEAIVPWVDFDHWKRNSCRIGAAARLVRQQLDREAMKEAA